MWRRWLRDVNGALRCAAVVLAVLDLIYPIAFALSVHAYDVAPKNSSLNAADDVGYFGTDLVAGLVALLRDAWIVVLAVGIILQLRRMWKLRARPRPDFLLVVLAAVTAAVAEAVRVAGASGQDHPTSGMLQLTIIVCAVNLGAVVVIVRASSFPSSAAAADPNGPYDMRTVTNAVEFPTCRLSAGHGPRSTVTSDS